MNLNNYVGVTLREPCFGQLSDELHRQLQGELQGEPRKDSNRKTY